VNSAIYRGTVSHRRTEPVLHAFRYPLFMMFLDLDELPRLFQRRWLWSAERPALAWFRRADYLGDPGTELAEAVRERARALTGHRPTGPVRMLTHLRYFGFVMNPVSFYYCYESDGRTLDTILAEITNTPWRERHTYALRADGADAGHDVRRRFDKAFHVSPFMAMDQEYEWRLSAPGDRLLVHMRNRTASGPIFDASLDMERQEISGPALAGALVRYPLMTVRVAAGIYWQALRLRLKGSPYHDHPSRRAA